MLAMNKYFVNTDILEESDEYLNKQIITYIGNKRSLLPFIQAGLNKILRRLNKDKIISVE